MVVRICVRNALSGTDAPSDVNRLPQSSSSAGPVNPAGTPAAPALGARVGHRAIRTRQATMRTYTSRLELIRVSFRYFNFRYGCHPGKRKKRPGTTIQTALG